MFKNWKNIKKHRKNTVQNAQNQCKVLVAPLDWGLGHITRCIPLIRYLLQKNCQISIASNAPGRALLQAEFPGLHYLDLEGYNIIYPPEGRDFRKKMLAQAPRIIRAIYREKAWLVRQQEVYQWDLIISDNRYGLYLQDIPSVIITHQLAIRSGINRAADRLLQWLNYNRIRKFSQCWIPDLESTPNLAGELSHPPELPPNAVYIGPLSRMEKKSIPENGGLLIILSGPEPQRTLLEEKLMKELEHFNGPVVVIRGLPGNETKPENYNGVIFYNHLPAVDLERAVSQAAMIICRSGYSTIMDLVAMKKPAILIPTPGQTEQEYLAEYLMQEKMFYTTAQEKFSLNRVLKDTETFPFRLYNIPFDSFKKSIDQFVKSH